MPGVLFCLVAVLLAIPAAYGFGVDNIIERHDADMWHLGKGISPGDFFFYNVCDASLHPQVSKCYTVRLDFYAELLSPAGEKWVVQAEITDSEHILHHHIFLVDSDTFDITTGHQGIEYAASVNDTIFYLAQFASKHDSKQIRMGQAWGDVPTTLNHAELTVTTEDTIHLADGNTVDVAILEYWVFESSTFVVAGEIGLPVSATVYHPYARFNNPALDFAFELIDSSAYRNLDLHDRS